MPQESGGAGRRRSRFGWIRRRDVRHPTGWDGRCQLTGISESSSWISCRMVDVSEAGAGLELPLEQILGGRLVVDLELPTGQAAEFRLVGEIKNMSMTSDGTLRLGIEFVEVGDFERVVLALLRRQSA